MAAVDPYEMSLSITDERDGHTTVLLQPAHFPDFDDERATAVSLAEWNHARLYHAGVIARVAAYVHSEVRDKLACCSRENDQRCGTSFGGDGTDLLNPNADWGSCPWAEFTVPRTSKKALITLVNEALQILAACDSRTFTEAEEQAWQEGAT